MTYHAPVRFITSVFLLLCLCLVSAAALAQPVSESPGGEATWPPATAKEHTGPEYLTTKFESECNRLSYYCAPTYYWSIPGMADYAFMRFSVVAADTSLTSIGFGLNYPAKIGEPDLDVFICDDDNGFPDLSTVLYQATVPYEELVWYPSYVHLDLTAESLAFHHDFHIGWKTNRDNAPQGVLAIVTDNGACGTERSTIYRLDSWHHLRDVSGVDYNLLIYAYMCNFDFDGDGVLNDDDNCVMTYNPSQADRDGDLVGDTCDNCIDSANTAQVDVDGDDIGDVCDNCTGTANADQINSDADSLGDACDNCPLDDNDDQADRDDDDLGDICDACPDDPDNDIDGDEICGDLDNCPATANPLQEDADGDGLGDACDECTDLDDDGYGDPGYAANTCPDDNCPADYNPDQGDADGDGIGDLCDTCTDSDGDGLGDPGYTANLCADDNCPTVFNPDQEDIDEDGVGDSCDVCLLDPDNDIDADGHCGDVDNCPKDYNPGQSDGDGDGIGDACEGLDSVYIDIGRPGLAPPVDTLFAGNDYQLRIWIRNEAIVGGMSLGFRVWWDSGVTWNWQPQPDGYGPGGPGTGLACVTVAADSRMYPPEDVWDLGGFIATETDMDALAPDTILLGGVSFYGQLDAGPLQHMISLNFRPEFDGDEVYHICIDSAYVPPTGNFILVDYYGDPITLEINRDLCWPVRQLCGDANGDKLINVGDAVFLINYVFKDGQAPDPIEDGDANGDGEPNVGDAVYLINHIFKEGPPPVCP